MKKGNLVYALVAFVLIVSLYSFNGLPQTKRVVYAIAFKDIKCKNPKGDTTNVREHLEIVMGDPAQNPYNERERLQKELEKKYKGTIVKTGTRIADGEVIVLITYYREVTGGFTCKPLMYSVGAGKTYEEALADATRIISANQKYEVKRL